MFNFFFYSFFSPRNRQNSQLISLIRCHVIFHHISLIFVVKKQLILQYLTLSPWLVVIQVSLLCVLFLLFGILTSAVRVLCQFFHDIVSARQRNLSRMKDVFIQEKCENVTNETVNDRKNQTQFPSVVVITQEFWISQSASYWLVYQSFI